jgi:hypothetical protein
LHRVFLISHSWRPSSRPFGTAGIPSICPTPSNTSSRFSFVSYRHIRCNSKPHYVARHLTKHTVVYQGSSSYSFRSRKFVDNCGSAPSVHPSRWTILQRCGWPRLFQDGSGSKLRRKRLLLKSFFSDEMKVRIDARYLDRYRDHVPYDHLRDPEDLKSAHPPPPQSAIPIPTRPPCGPAQNSECLSILAVVLCAVWGDDHAHWDKLTPSRALKEWPGR